MLERWERIQRQKGNTHGAEIARVLREQFGDEPLINSENSLQKSEALPGPLKPEEQEQKLILPEPLYNSDGAALYPLQSLTRYFGISHPTVLDIIRKGKARAEKPGSEWFVNLEDIENYLTSPQDRSRQLYISTSTDLQSSENRAEEQKTPPSLRTKDGSIVSPIGVLAKNFDISVERITQLVKEQRIRAVKPRRDWFVNVDDVKNYVQAPQKVGRPRGKRTRNLNFVTLYHTSEVKRY